MDYNLDLSGVIDDIVAMQQLVSADGEISSNSTSVEVPVIDNNNNNNQNMALAPSIVSGTTDLFEGDLCDDELDEIPSVMFPHGAGGDAASTTGKDCAAVQYDEENLQFDVNPVDLVDQVQAEVAAAEEEESAALLSAAASVAAVATTATNKQEPGGVIMAHDIINNSAASTTTSTVNNMAIIDTTTETNKKPAVVPFAVVRRLSHSGEPTKRPASADNHHEVAYSTETTTAPLHKKARTAPTTKPEGRVTRARAAQLAKEKKTATTKKPRTTSNRTRKTKQTKNSAVTMVEVAIAPAPTTDSVAPAILPEPSVATAALSIISSKDATDTNNTKSDQIIMGTTSNSKDQADLPVVTPVTSDEAVTARQMALSTKMETASLPLPTLSGSKTTTVVQVATELVQPKSDPNQTNEASATAEQVPVDAAVTDSTSIPATTITAAASTSTTANTVAKPDPATTASFDTKTSTKKTSSRSRASSSSASNNKTNVATKLDGILPVTIDTSTAHIQALTGENGASVCASVRNCTAMLNAAAANRGKAAVVDQATSTTTATSSSISISPNADHNKSSDTNTATSSSDPQQPLTEEERAQQSRDRNRKHARNTRLRKKAYVEELKQTLNELVKERDHAMAQKQQKQLIQEEQREVRFRVMEEFLKLRGRNESDGNKWSAILAPDFGLTVPPTPLVDTPSTAATRGGVEQAMEDSNNLSTFLQTVGSNPNDSDEVMVTLVHHCDRKDFVMDDCHAVLSWNATSVGAVTKGAKEELSFRGNLSAHFCPESNRLRSVDIMFDTGTLKYQRDNSKAGE